MDVGRMYSYCWFETRTAHSASFEACDSDSLWNVLYWLRCDIEETSSAAFISVEVQL